MWIQWGCATLRSSLLATRCQWKIRQYAYSRRIQGFLIADGVFFQLGLCDAPPDGSFLIGIDHVDDKRTLRVLSDANVGLVHAVVAVIHGVSVVATVSH